MRMVAALLGLLGAAGLLRLVAVSIVPWAETMRLIGA
jgi:hypothetical protein